MKSDIKTHVKFLQRGLKQLLMIEKQNVINGTPRLRNKQFEALYALTKLSDEKVANGYYKLPTGFGKTVMFSYMARAYLEQIHANNANKKLVILVPRLNLINQTNEKLDTFAGFSAAEFSSRNKAIDADIIICTYQSLENLLQTLGIENIGMVFADEAHHMLGEKKSQMITELIKFAPIIGFTATPAYDANKSVSQILNNEIYAMNLAEGVRCGVLAPAKNILYCSSIVFDLEQAELTSHGEYDYESIASQIDISTLTDEIADIYAAGYDEDTGRKFIESKAIINCPNIKIAKCQAEAINKKVGKIVACAFSSEMPDFEAEKQKFISGKYTVACQVNTLTEGFDDPAVNLCINYPTHSYVKAEQAAGRAIRLNDNDSDKIAFVVDTVFKKYANDACDTVLQTARHANQVLFKDVAGQMVLIPKEKQERISSLSCGVNVRDVQRDIKPYKIITSSEVLMELYAQDTKKAAQEKVQNKTDEWIGTKDLTQCLVGSQEKMLEKLKELQPVMSDKIQKRQNGAVVTLFLHVSALDEFAKHAGITKRTDIPEKTSEWLGKFDLKQYLVGKYSKVAECLIMLQNVMPDKIQMRKPMGGASATLCLHIGAIDEFAKKSGLVKRDAVFDKTEEWLSALDLVQYFKVQCSKITDSLNDLQDVLPDKIQLRQPHGCTPTLCLHVSAVDEFATKSGLSRRDPSLEKTEEWLARNDLLQHFVVNDVKLVNVLKELQSVMPDKIQCRRSKVGRMALCLHVDALEEFAKRSGFIKRGTIPSKTEEWLSAPDLAQRFIGDRSKMLCKLTECQNAMPDKIRLCQPHGCTPTLCLHVSAVDEFAKLAGLKKRADLSVSSSGIAAAIKQSKVYMR